MLMFGDAMSIAARSTCAPSGNSPARMRRNRSRLSAAGPARGSGLFRARLRQRPAIVANLVGGEAVHVGLAVANQLLGERVHLLEVVRGVEHPLGPVESEPAHVLLDRVDVLDVFLRRIGVVEAEVADPAEFLGDAEVETDRLGVADVQIPVGFGRETRVTRRPCRPALQIAGDDLTDEVEWTRGFDSRRAKDRTSENIRF